MKPFLKAVRKSVGITGEITTVVLTVPAPINPIPVSTVETKDETDKIKEGIIEAEALVNRHREEMAAAINPIPIDFSTTRSPSPFRILEREDIGRYSIQYQQFNGEGYYTIFEGDVRIASYTDMEMARAHVAVINLRNPTRDQTSSNSVVNEEPIRRNNAREEYILLRERLRQERQEKYSLKNIIKNKFRVKKSKNIKDYSINHCKIDYSDEYKCYEREDPWYESPLASIACFMIFVGLPILIAIGVHILKKS